MKISASLAIVLLLSSGLLGGAAAHAGEPRYANIVLTDERGSAKNKRTFTPSTPQIFLLASLVEVPAGAKVSGVWIAEKTEVAPPDYKIDSVELTVGRLMNKVTFSLSKPNAGWPAGSYRVELFINGKPAGKVPFKVSP